MSNSSAMLRKIFDEARPLVEQALDLSDKFKGFRELATANGLDWSQIKALLKAQIQDEREDDGKDRVGRIIEKADFATAYADMLGLAPAKMNENNSSEKVRLTVAIDDEVARRLGMDPEPPHDPTTGKIIEPVDRRSTEGVTASPEECGVSGQPPAPSDGGDHEVELEAKSSDLHGTIFGTPSGADTGSAVEASAQVSVFDRSSGAASVTTDECGGQPSQDCSGSVSEAREQSEKVGTEGKDCNAPGLAVRAVQYLAGQGASSPAPSQSVALALPVVTDAPVEQSPADFRDNAPGAPFPEMPDFLKRSAA